MPNRLADQSSPYLLQHANNPVDWHAWGPEALELAKTTGRPIFLSVGYSACHWCHVMEHESFENSAIAQLMNDHFVCIKVDREERPDIDQIYMSAVQIMTGRGGWPMSVFLTPNLQPFYGGTYWPPTARMGMPGFDQVLAAVAEAWEERRLHAVEQASDLTNHLREVASPTAVEGELSWQLLDSAAKSLQRALDAEHGGFGGAPKFPHPMDLRMLLHVWRRNGEAKLLEMVTFTLDRMAAGGIYDQLGGGFHRYSVDERWLVPHFEKMLYDNALLTSSYVEAFLATRNDAYARVVRETCDYVLREMTDPAGGFYSTQDADSEGEEGKFFLWTPAEVEQVLGQNAAKAFCAVYDVSQAGNFEQRNILNLPSKLEQCAKSLEREPAELQTELDASRQKLRAAREERVHPGLDDKVLVAWNGLMIEALSAAAMALNEPRYLQAASRAADFLLVHLRRADGRLLHCWRHGEARLDAYLDDYASLTAALLSLYQAGFDERYVDAAVELADTILNLFSDPGAGGFFYTASDHEQLITRPKDLFDNATPSGNSLAATALVRLGKLTGRSDYLAAAEATFRAGLVVMLRSSTAAGQMLMALDMYLGPTSEIVILGELNSPRTQAILADLNRRYVPNKIVALREPGPQRRSPALDPLFAGKGVQDAQPTVYICQNFACQSPVTDHEAAARAFDQLPVN